MLLAKRILWVSITLILIAAIVAGVFIFLNGNAETFDKGVFI